MLGFRVWDSEEKRFLSTIEERRKITIFDDGMLSIYSHEPLSEEDLSRYIPMQSTGIKDCNDILIYEGDILLDGDTYYLVEDVIGFLTQIEYLGDNSEMHDFKFIRPIIGNKFLNPELLERLKW